mgnify:CR=1 FL=1
MKEKKRRVKNLIVEQEFMDVLEQELVNAPSSWLLIRYGTYKELHYEDSIYRFFDAKKLIDLRKDILEQTEGQNLFKKLAENNINLSKFEFKKPTLNEIFIEKVGA